MSTEKNTFYVTTPIYYVTAKPHLGHLYSTVIADVLARWNKIQNKKVCFLTGTDEFGQKIAQAAAKVGKEPQEFVDSFIDAYKKVWEDFEIDYTIFMRTTNQFHVKAVQHWLTSLLASGDIYKAFYTGWYCTHCETFIQESTDLQQIPLCPTCSRETHKLAEETYFFKLSAYQDRLLELYEKNPNFIIPRERAQEIVNFVKSGLKDLSISRTTVKWGVPFPNDSKHVTYVWADALNNYITAIGWGQKERKQEFTHSWPADVHVMGKDILRFHAVYWPAFLMASGLELPKHLLVHGWFKVGTQKMSKSFGNVVDPVELNKIYGPEPVRYYLMRQMAITHDGEFTIEDLEQKISSDLADDLGNLLNRMVTLALKYQISEITTPQQWSSPAQELHQESLAMIKDYQIQINDYMFHIALSRLWKFINQTNAYFHSQEPWKQAQKNMSLFQEILSATAHALQTIAILLWPIMPKKMEQLLSSLGVMLDQRNNNIHAINNVWNNTFMINKIENLFEKPIEKESSSQEAKETIPETKEGDFITIDDFAKVNLMVGTIESCNAIDQSDKLYKLIVNFGPYGTRQILSGVRKYFEPENLIGKQGVFVTNLAPRKMMGLESQGMLLTVQTADKKMSILSPAISVENGTQLK